MSLYLLKNQIKFYDWGSPVLMAEMLGMENRENRPMAELWMGAHEGAPSMAVTERGEVPLPRLIADQPEAVLGEKTVSRFSGSFPFLFKVLAADRPLSIQAHPTKKEAEEGFQKENREGIPIDAYERKYKDDNHKPEIIRGITDFYAMRGFRSVSDIQKNLTQIFDADSLPFTMPDPEDANPSRELRAFFASLMELSKEKVEGVVEIAVKHKERLLDESSPGRKGATVNDPFLTAEWIVKLHQFYPGDIGVLAPLFLNMIHLRPGEGMFLPAGELHAYLYGLGIELMANSDNVLRGGCTSKYIARDELLKILRFEEEIPEIYSPPEDGPMETVYPSDADEFTLSSLRLSEDRYRSGKRGSVEVLLCGEGSGMVRIANDPSICSPAGSKTVKLRQGDSVLICAAAGEYELEGDGTFFKAAAGNGG